MTSTNQFDQLVMELGIDPAETGRRLAFLEFGPDDVAALTDLHAQLEARKEAGFFVEEFYRHLLNFEETRALIADPDRLVRLKRSQTEYFHGLTQGEYGEGYVRHRLRVGVAHERIGLAPKWYLGAYRKYLSFMLPKIAEIYREDHDRLAAQQALLKIILFDMGLAIDTYIHAAQRVVRSKTAQLGALNRVAASLTSSMDRQDIMDQIMYHGADVVGASATCIAFYDEATNRFTGWVTHGLSDRFVSNMAFSRGGLADETFTTGGHILSNDRPETKHQLSRLARAEGVLSFLCLPLTSHAQRLGVIYFYLKDRDSFSHDEVELLKTFASLAAGAIENARIHARAVEESVTDALTGLPNRRQFDRRLTEEQARAQRYGKPYAFMMLDIDHFKQVNDSYGHAAGDVVLKQLTAILKKQFRDSDIPARYGGEEFAVILPEISSTATRPVAERVRLAVASTPFRLPDGREIGVTVSIGVSCYPNCAATAQAVVDRADQALYTAKQSGRNRVVLYRDMLKARIEKDPDVAVALLNEGPGNIKPLLTALAVKGPYFWRHPQACERTAVRLAEALRLSEPDTQTLKTASLLHDIGMIPVPDEVLAKTTAALTPGDWEQIRRHATIAAGWLERVPVLAHLAPIVRHHHEHLDGSGYPDGLKGEAIPYLARVLAVADAYASMSTAWPGHRERSEAEVREELRHNRGTQFDATIVDALLAALGPV